LALPSPPERFDIKSKLDPFIHQLDRLVTMFEKGDRESWAGVYGSVFNKAHYFRDALIGEEEFRDAVRGLMTIPARALEDAAPNDYQQDFIHLLHDVNSRASEFYMRSVRL
jgi:hypothetical protein